MSIPVICDRCRHTGIAGEADFSHLGDLLEFKPVPRKNKRADGWTPEKQRAFIAALSATGSKRQAAQAVGMAPYGVENLLRNDGGDSFKAAVERAMAIAAQNGSMKIAQGVADAAARNAQLTPPSRLRGLPAPAEGQVLNEYSEPEDEDSYRRRADDAKDSIANKLLRIRRLFLQEICASDGFDYQARKRILDSKYWTGSEKDLDAILENALLVPPHMTIRDGVDFVHFSVYATIKALKFSSNDQVCGGPIELAVITTDRKFRWVRHKGWDSAIGTQIP